MLFKLVLVSRNRSVYARTLHTVLAIQGACRQNGIDMDVIFADDNEVEKLKILKTNLKGCDRILWFDYGMSVTPQSVSGLFLRPVTGVDCGVLPAPVKDAIDWGTFVSEVNKNTSEPNHQIALTFDTEVGPREIIPDIMYEVKSTCPQLWWADSKKMLKKINKNAPTARVMDDIFKNAKLQFGAVVGADVHTHFTHECMGGIMNMSGIRMA